MKFVPLSETEKSTPEEGEPSGLTFVPLQPEAKPAPKAEAKPAPKAEAKPAPKAEAKQPAPAPAKKQPVLSEPAPSYDLMGGDLGAAIMDVAGTAKPDLGVMNDVPSQPPQKDAFLPIRPEVRQALINAYNAGTPAERAKLEALEGVKGDVVRQYAQGFKANQAKRKKEFERRQRIGLPLFLGVEEQFDPSVEARTARLIAAGEKPEFAEAAARQSAAAGVPVGQEIKFMQSQGTLEKTDFDFEMFEKYRNANPLIRAGVAGFQGFKQGALGVNQAVADALGFDEFARTQVAGAKESRTTVESMGENPNYLARQFEGAVGSLAQQLPALFAGAITGTQGVVYASMFLQTFGQEYSTATARGQDKADASIRAGLFATFEIIGERFGLKFELDNIRRAARGMKTDQLKDFLANTLKKELPGEYLTTTGQFLVDKSNIGLNKNATLADYLQQMTDTTVQTVMQSGLMTGGVKAVEKGVSLIPKRETEEAIPTAEELMQQKGFITPSRKAPAKAPATEATTEAAAKPAETPAETPEAKEDLAAKRQAQVNEVAADLVAMSGLDADTALKIAEGRVRAQEEQAAKEEQQRQDALQKEAAARTTLVPPAENRVQEITDELIGAGVDPTEAAQRAVAMAQQEAENDALAEQEGVTDAGEFIPTTGELGAGVSGERGVGVPAGGTTEALTAGLVPAGATTGESTEGKAVQPSALEQAQEQVARAERELIIAQENGDLLETSRARASLMQAQNQLAEAKQQEEGEPAATKRATKTEAPAPGIRLRRPTEREKSNLSASAVIDFGTEGKAVIAEGLQDVYIRDAQGNELAVRQWDSRPGNIKVASDFPAFVPESLRQPIIDYQDAAYKNKAGTPETEAALKDARDKLQDAVADLIKQQEEQRGAKTTEAEQAEAQRAAESEAGVPPTTGKRGRPRLAPEAKLTAEDKRRQQRTAYKAIEKRLNDAERDLAESSEPVDEGEATSGEHLDEMYDNKARQRQSAINRLYDISKENRGKPGQRALELLSQNASTAEIKTAAEGYQFRKQRAAAEATSKAVEQVAAETVADEKLGRATNGAQAITQIIRTGTPFQQMLARRLRSFVNNVKIVVVEADQAVPEALTRNPRYQREWDRARALYIENYATGARTIYVRGASFGESQGVNNVTILHELVHAATNKKVELGRQAITKGTQKGTKLVRATEDLIQIMNNAGERFNELAARGELPAHISRLARFGEIFDDPREFVAYGMTDPAFQEFLRSANALGGTTSYWSMFVDALRRLIGMDPSETNALADLLDVTDTILTARPVGALDLMEGMSPMASTGKPETEEDAAEKEEAVRTQKTIDREEDIALEKIYISEDAEETARQAGVLQAIRDPRKMLPALRSLWDSSNEKRRKLFVRMVTRDTLATWGGSYVPELLNTHDLVNDMGNLTRQLLTASADIAKAIQRAYKEDRTLPQKLSRVAYLSTLLEINPADPKAKERANKLDKMYADLGAKGQQLYQLLVQQATNIADYYSALLDQQIENAQLTPDIKSRLMVQIRQLYETRQRINPYFQLVRRGDYVLRVGQGRYRQFYTAPTLAGRDAIANKIAEQRRVSVEQLEADGDIEKINDINVIRNNALDSSPMLKNLFDLIDAEQFSDPNAKDNLKDAVYQLYLSTMPDQSFRNQFLNRKQITGFSTDLLRNFSESSTKMATQLARVKYGPLLRNSLSAAQDSISGRSDLQPFVSEMTRRVNLVLNPPAPTGVDTVVNGVNTASSVFYLSSWSSALLQPLSIFQSGYWVLGARYGYLNTGREFTKMLKIWNQYGTSRKLPDGTVAFIAPTITSAKGVTADEKMALRDMASLMESTYIGEMFRYRQTPTAELRGVYNKTKDVASIATFGLLYSTERLSREFIALSSYRLHRQMLDKAVKAGDMTAEEARKQSVKAAIRNTTDSLADYSLENRPPIMQRGAGKALLQFTMFQLHTTLFLARNFKRMTFSLASPAERWEATKIFFGVLGGTFILGGLRALPMFSIAMGILAFFWKDEDRPQELKDLDFETWWRTIHLPEMLGKVKVGGKLLSDVIDRGLANALTGWDISSRTSLNNMWLRETKEMKTLREEAVALGVEKAGPFLNMMLSYADGIEAAMDGKYEKAIEKMAPSLVRNLMTAHKYYSEGVIERHGAEVMMQGSISDLELLGQAIGFRPSILASQQEMAFKYNSIQQSIKNKRQKIMDRIGEEYMKAERTQDITEYARLLEEKDKFNLKYPSYRITKDNLKDSLKERREQRAAIQAWSGISMDKKFAPIGAESALNVTEEIAERNEQERKRREKEGK